jgi:hypothetical protein
MLEVSSNEIYSETYKALRSVEVDWGLAKDCANLAKWLAHHNQYFLGSILKTLDLYKKKEISISIKKTSLNKPFSGALMGLLLVEYISENNIKWQGHIHNPKFLIAAMSIITNEQKSNLILRNKNKDIIACTNKGNLYSNLHQFNNITDYYILEINEHNEKYDLINIVPTKISDVTQINNKCWDRLKSMAFETYVPESETSKSRAGY